jgi:DNA processing protein
LIKELTMPSLDVLSARLFQLRATEPAPATYAYTAMHGPVDAVERIRNGTAPAAVLGEVARPRARIDDDLRTLDAGTAHLLTPEDDDWPLGRLGPLGGHGVPLALWTRGTGSLAELTSPAVTITGARASSDQGDTIAADYQPRTGPCRSDRGQRRRPRDRRRGARRRAHRWRTNDRRPALRC